MFGFVKTKFYLNPGAAESNSAVSAAFNQYRSALLDKFIEDFNTETNDLPFDILLPTTVYIPTQPGTTNEFIFYDIQYPNLSFLYKKINQFQTKLIFNNLKYVEFDLYLLNSVIQLTSLNVKYRFVDIKKARHIFKTFFHSLKSYTTQLYRKEFFFIICKISVKNIVFYRFQLANPFNTVFR